MPLSGTSQSSSRLSSVPSEFVVQYPADSSVRRGGLCHSSFFRVSTPYCTFIDTVPQLFHLQATDQFLVASHPLLPHKSATMPRQQRRAAPTPARSAPTRPTAAPARPAAPASQQSQPHSTAAHPSQATPMQQAAPVQQSSGGGFLSQIASTAA